MKIKNVARLCDVLVNEYKVDGSEDFDIVFWSDGNWDIFGLKTLVPLNYAVRVDIGDILIELDTYTKTQHRSLEQAITFVLRDIDKSIC